MMKALSLFTSLPLFLFPIASSPVSFHVGFRSQAQRGPTERLTPYDQLHFQIEQDFLFPHELSKKDYERITELALNEANPKHVGLEAPEIQQLSHQVVRTSQCYGIDPVIFTSLIWRESNFKPVSVSERGAVGLTQMTQTGVREVLERLSTRSTRRLGSLRALVKKCNPEIWARLPAEASADVVAAWKNSASQSTVDALVLGALLLKINLASMNPRHKTAEIYRVALEHYNGDPKVKSKFAREVLLLSKRMTSFPEIALNELKFPVSTPTF